MDYISLGPIVCINLDRNSNNNKHIDDIIINCSNGTLCLYYTTSCCEESYFLDFDDKALVGKIIESIILSSSGYDGPDTEDEDKYCIEDKIYTITFTDTTTHDLTLRCRSNGCYSTSLLQNIKLNN